MAVHLPPGLFGNRITEPWDLIIMIINNLLRNKIAIALLTAPMVVAGGNVLAQDAESDDSMVLEEVIVTAQKMEQREQEVPISIKTIGSDVLEMINAERFEDMGRLVPSLSFTDRQRGQNQVLIRGLGTVNGVSTVAVYNDGVVAANRIGSNGSFGEIDPSFYDIDRVEVLRGPQGTLYGEGSFGGVINIISKRPDASGFDGSASVTWRDVKEGSSSNYGREHKGNGCQILKQGLALKIIPRKNIGTRQGHNDRQKGRQGRLPDGKPENACIITGAYKLVQL